MSVIDITKNSVIMEMMQGLEEKGREEAPISAFKKRFDPS